MFKKNSFYVLKKFSCFLLFCKCYGSGTFECCLNILKQVVQYVVTQMIHEHCINIAFCNIFSQTTLSKCSWLLITLRGNFLECSLFVDSHSVIATYSE